MKEIMKKTLLIIAIALFFVEGKSQNIDLNNSSDYIRVQKTGETGFSRAFGLNGANQLYIGSVEKTIGNMYFFNKGTGHLMTLNPSGNLGVGTTNPGAKLDILSNTGQTESLMRFKISDAPSDYLQIANSTGSANQFIPLIKGYHQTDNRYSLAIMGSTSDAMDNGSNALINFNARRLNSAVQNRPLFAWTNYDQKMMTMSANGNLGIGTTNPLSKLTVVGHVNIGGEENYRLRTRHVDGKDYQSRAISDLYLNYNTGKHVRVGFGGQDSNLYVSGNTGVGTANPSAKLHVVGVIKTSNTDGRYVNLFTSGDGNSYINIAGGSTTSRFGFQVDGSSKMSIMKNGNVGIGTADTKGYKLGVKGKIAAEEVKVALHSNWPDYVFKDSYNLPTLQQVENHIAEKGHLENIPSAAEVGENGIQLGEMNAKLLQKIEELTLYMIEQNKKTDNLIKEVKALKQKNAELEKKMK
ncbi:hypothetical protein [Aquimarina latercula]|uniref:hypothetical protein n=1 Tax=Aquimarina latercula TaxID=987 RepID=UPI0003F72F81|nr:hypothetical protein [Aquimarina latercula]